MISVPAGNDYTPWVPLQSGACKACGRAGSGKDPNEVFSYPKTAESLVLCTACARGLTMCIAKELKQRHAKKPTPPKAPAKVSA